MGKFNEEQLRTLLEFMTMNPVMLQKRSRSNNKPRMDLWKDLAEKLNSHGPPYKSEIDWRRSWAKKKFEMARVKKRRVSVYADLDNLLARASELNESRSGCSHEEDDESDRDVKRTEADPLLIRKKDRRVDNHQSGSGQMSRRMKTELMGKKDETLDGNPNISSDIQWLDESSFTPEATSHKRRPRKPSCSSLSSSSDGGRNGGQRKRSRESSRKSEDSVELFFKSLALEVNKANLPSEHLFNLEWSVLKLVSEKIKEFTEGVALVQPTSGKPPLK
ncbi:uncharacterized protein LOC132262719 [Phlebotomus argentipes]|uniref:uncharacterized protein LOC132262719 n=1 Tax=Phlebotomus argentipes TaxID=94469 RepID=UPI0028930D9C|nr:uncharacterized protein LOC132262719 [Phlebotomus argentipes]